MAAVMLAFVGPPVAGWCLLIGAFAAALWIAVGLVVPARRPFVATGVLAVCALALAYWMPFAPLEWPSWLGVAALLLPAGLLAAIAAIVNRSLRGNLAFTGLTLTLALVLCGLIGAQSAALRARVVVRHSALDSAAAQLLKSGSSGFFAGTGPAPSGAYNLDPKSATGKNGLPVIDAIAGIPVAYGEVRPNDREVVYCLEPSEVSSCAGALVYAPGSAIDGQTDMRSIDCDLVTNALAGDWYYRSVRCTRM